MIKSSKIFSARFLWLSFILLIMTNARLHATNLSGVITADTLKVANSPFIVIGNISVLSGHTLTIEAGVELRFNSGLSLTIDGSLSAPGTVADSIRFTSNQTSPNPGDWSGIIINSSSVAFKYVVLEYSSSGTIISGVSPVLRNSSLRNNNNGIDCLASASPVIADNVFFGNGNTAIRCINSTPMIKRNSIHNNVAISSAILCDASSPTISGNIFYANSNTAVDCLNGANPKIWQNTVYQNNFGITLNDVSSPEIKNNIIANNLTYGIAINDAGAAPVIGYNDVHANTVGNYFGTETNVGSLTTTNANGDAADIYFNISMAPAFTDPNGGNFELLSNSPCIDSGDQANPAGIVHSGSAPDMGYSEYFDALPVELISFLFSHGVLKWTTASEMNNFGFEVQRRAEKGGPFKKVGFVRGAGTTSQPQQYEYRDEVSSGTFYYRLNQIDTDGSFAFSPVIEAVYSVPDRISLAQNYPNPFNPTTTISFTVPGTGDENIQIKLSIYDAAGQRVRILFNGIKPSGMHQLQWNGDDNFNRKVATGVYFYRFEYGGQALTKRMLLIR